jgi:hypothetical protein
VLNFGDRSIAFWVISGIASSLFLLVLLLTFVTLQPIEGWRTEVSPAKIIQHYIRDPRGPDARYAYENIVLEFGEWIDNNAALLGRFRTLMQLTILAAGCELLSLLLLVWFASP